MQGVVAFKKADCFVEDEDFRLILVGFWPPVHRASLKNANAFFESIYLLKQAPFLDVRFLNNLFPCMANNAFRHLLSHLLHFFPELGKVKRGLMVSMWRMVVPRNWLLFVKLHFEVLPVLLDLLEVLDGHLC